MVNVASRSLLRDDIADMNLFAQDTQSGLLQTSLQRGQASQIGAEFVVIEAVVVIAVRLKGFVSVLIGEEEEIAGEMDGEGPVETGAIALEGFGPPVSERRGGHEVERKFRIHLARE